MRAVLRVAAVVALMTTLIASDARAQSPSPAVWGYAFLGAGVHEDAWAIATSYFDYSVTPAAIARYHAMENTVEWGGGVEWAMTPAVGIGAELRAMHLSEAPEYPGGIVSVNGTYHFRQP